MTKKLIITKENLRRFLGSLGLRYFNSNFSFVDTLKTAELSNISLTKFDTYSLTETLKFYIDTDRHNAGKTHKFILLDEAFITEIEVEDLIDQVKSVLDKFMPGRYFIDEKNIYLHYPEFEITNDIGETHIIKDLVVLIETLENKIVSIKGNRYTYTKKELLYNYRHSHLPKRSYDEFNLFCLGGGSPVARFVDQLKRSCSTDQFELLLAQLDQYLIWESRAGNPHISISVFYTINETRTPQKLDNTLVEKIATTFLQHIQPAWLTLIDDNHYFFDPAGFEDVVYNLELEITRGLVDTYGYGYDTTTNRYVNHNDDTPYVRLPEFGDVSKKVMKAFNIKPSIVEDTIKFSNTNIIKRLGTEDLHNIFNKINNLLKLAVYKNGAIEVTA